MQAESYRPNAAMIFRRSDGRILVCERSKPAGAWQFPQGGIDAGETAEEAASRESMEEIGYPPSVYEIVFSRSGYRYRYPAEDKGRVHKKRGISYVGQEQTYFMCQLQHPAPAPVIDGREFRDYQWIYPEEFDMNWLPDFKKEVYRQVLKDFFGIDA